MGNQTKGRDLVLSVSVDGGTTFNPIAGIRTKEYTRENPISDTTNQADTGQETGAAYTGYSTVTLSGNGVVDTRTASLYAYKALAAAAHSSTVVLLCKLADALGEEMEGNFLISSFGKNSEQNGIVEFSIAMQNEGSIAYTAIP